MILQIFAIRDSAAGSFGRPFFLPANGVATRSFMDEVNRPAQDNMMYQHPDDFELFHFGSFDDETGKFFIIEPQSIMRGKDVVRSASK